MIVKNLLLMIVLSITAINIVYSQPAQYWIKYNSGIEYDYTRDLAKDSHGNYIVSGTSVVSNPGFLNYGIRTIKYDSLGNLKWMKVKDFTSSMDDPFQILLDDSNNIYIFGILETGYSIGTFFLMKYDELGDEKWFKTFSSFSNYYELTDRACIDGDGNIYCAGATEINNRLVSFVRKYSSDGNLVWYKELDTISTLGDYPNCIIPDLNGNLYLAGGAIITDTTIYHYITKLDQNGNPYWQSYYGTDTCTSARKPKKLIMAENLNLYLLGMSNTNNGGYDFNIIKIDSLGFKIWENIVRGYGYFDSYPKDIVLDNNNDVYVTGSITEFFPPNLISNLLITSKFDKDGNQLWERILGQEENFPGIGISLEVDESNNIYVPGGLSHTPHQTPYDMLILKYTSNGDSLWSISKVLNNFDETPVKIVLNSEDDFTTILVGVQSFITIRYSNNPPVGIEDNFPLIQYRLLQNYPNPFNPSTSISYSILHPTLVNLKVYDILGNEIITLVNQVQSAGQHTIEFDGTNLSSGIYLYRLVTKNYIQTKKMILHK